MRPKTAEARAFDVSVEAGPRALPAGIGSTVETLRVVQDANGPHLTAGGTDGLRRRLPDLPPSLPQVTINPAELARLHRERASLADKMMTETLTRAERTRLRFLDWKIDRVEMAELAPAFAELDRLADLQRRAANGLRDLVDAAERASATRGKRRR